MGLCSAKERIFYLLPIITVISLLYIGSTLSTSLVYALPQIDEVQNGDVQVEQIDEHTLNITASENAIINYSSFNIGAQERVNFIQPNIDANILNRVTGNEMTELLGSLYANGNVFLVNSNGIHIGADAQVSVHGFIASTLNMSNADFLAGNYQFTQEVHAAMKALVNEGRIEADENGFVGLISGAVVNRGVIIAPVGCVVIGGGEQVTVSISHNNLIQIAVNEEAKELVMDEEGNPRKAVVLNQGEIIANGGKVKIEAGASVNLYEHIINQEGVVKAGRLVERDGVIELVADDDIRVAGRTEASGSVDIRADGDVIVESTVTDLETAEEDIVILGGDVVVRADADGDGVGDVLHVSGVIAATGDGDIQIDGVNLQLGRMEVEFGRILIGAHLAPATIEGTPEYVHKVGNITIIRPLHDFLSLCIK